jgi:hypothetical protein
MEDIMSRKNGEQDKRTMLEPDLKDRKRWFEREILELNLGIDHGWVPRSEDYFIWAGHMLTDQFEAAAAQGRRVANGEILLHGENVLIYSPHAKSIGAILERLMRLVVWHSKEESTDSVMEKLMIRVLQGRYEPFQVTAKALIRMVSKPHLSLVVTPLC